jgi:GT2 family glycosyltransferase
MDPKITVDIIIINWNSGILTIEAIRPYLNCSSSFIECNVIIVDNGSQDNSKSIFTANNLNNVIYAQQNLGFGKACNLVLPTSKADYILLLNPDTSSSLTTLEKLVNFLENNIEYGVVGPQQLGDDESVFRTCARFPNSFTHFYEMTGLSKISPKIFHPQIMIDWDHLSSRDVDHLMGSYMLIRRSVLDKVGYMDPAYFVYLEDLDLSKRIHDAGYKSRFLATEKIYHQRGKSGDAVKATRLFYFMDARRIYWKKHFNQLTCYCLIITSLFIEPLIRIIDIVATKRELNIRNILSAYRLYLRGILKRG